MTKHVSRLAPSPTGALHLGNARTFLVNWALARNGGWLLLMRIEDLDGPRIRHDAARQALDDLTWLGIDYDGSILHQSSDLHPYRDTMRALAERSLVSSCDLTRTQIAAAASAPHANEHELCYPSQLRPRDAARFRFNREDSNYRLMVNDEHVEICDLFLGPSVHHPFGEVGDFVIWTRRGAPAYQLAVVVDDARQGVTDVVRGDDLLPSAARQTLLYRALGREPPRWWHLPLVVGPDGRRLAKRHGDTRLATYRDAGVAPRRIIGLLAFWCGLDQRPVEMTAEDFRRNFDVNTLPRSPAVFTERDHQWLLHGC
jgi:glutamyl-tRNA synthetase